MILFSRFSKLFLFFGCFLQILYHLFELAIEFHLFHKGKISVQLCLQLLIRHLHFLKKIGQFCFINLVKQRLHLLDHLLHFICEQLIHEVIQLLLLLDDPLTCSKELFFILQIFLRLLFYLFHPLFNGKVFLYQVFNFFLFLPRQGILINKFLIQFFHILFHGLRIGNTFLQFLIDRMLIFTRMNRNLID